jgi:hypothetical protein
MRTAVRADLSSNPSDLYRPYVQWKRNASSDVFHATVESAEMSWIRSGRVACNMELGHPGFVLTGIPGSAQSLCKRCVKKLEALYPLTEGGK